MGSFVVMESFFFFFFLALPPSSSLLIYFVVVGSFGLGLMFTCLHVRGTFCVAATDITDSKAAAAAARKREKGKIKQQK